MGADQCSGSDALRSVGCGLVQPVRTIEHKSQRHGCDGEGGVEGKHAVGDRRLAPKPFAIHVVISWVRVRENHIRVPVGPYALDHEDMPVVVAPSPDPRAMKTGNLGRHVGRRDLDIELVRQGDDRLRIDSYRLGLSDVHRTHEYHRNYRQKVAHVQLVSWPKSDATLAGERQAYRPHSLKEGSSESQCVPTRCQRFGGCASTLEGDLAPA